MGAEHSCRIITMPNLWNGLKGCFLDKTDRYPPTHPLGERRSAPEPLPPDINQGLWASTGSEHHAAGAGSAPRPYRDLARRFAVGPVRVRNSAT